MDTSHDNADDVDDYRREEDPMPHPSEDEDDNHGPLAPVTPMIPKPDVVADRVVPDSAVKAASHPAEGEEPAAEHALEETPKDSQPNVELENAEMIAVHSHAQSFDGESVVPPIFGDVEQPAPTSPVFGNHGDYGFSC